MIAQVKQHRSMINLLEISITSDRSALYN